MRMDKLFKWWSYMQLVPRHEESFIILVCAYILIKHKSQYTKLSYYVSFTGLQATPEQLLDHLLLEESVDDSYLQLTYRHITRTDFLQVSDQLEWENWSSWSGKCACVQCMCICLFIYIMFTWSTILSHSCTHHTTLTIHFLFLYVSHYTYYTCYISVCITLCLLYMSHFCTYHTMHMLTVHITLLYVSHYAYAHCVCHMYHTTLTIHVTFLYKSHYTYYTCHISVHITLHLLHMSPFCTYHTTLVRITLCMLTVHFTFLYTSHYTYCTCHISVRITLRLLYMSHFCTMHNMLTVHVIFLYVSHYAHYVTQILFTCYFLI